MFFQAILVSVLSSLLSIEWMNGHFGLSRPLVAGTLTGLLLGDVKTGIIIGAQLQLVFMGVTGVGAAVPPDQTIGTVLATAFAIISNQGPEIALALAIPVAVGAQALDILAKTVNTFLMHRADKVVEDSNYSSIKWLHYSGILVQFVRVSIIVFPAMYFGVEVTEKIVNMIPASVLRGLEVSGSLLPAVGFGMLLHMLNIKYLLPFYFIGFAFATFGGFSTIGITMISVCLALLIDYYTSNGKKENLYQNDDLDTLMEG